MVNFKPLDLEEYRVLINLDEPFKEHVPSTKNKIERLVLVDDLLIFLQSKTVENNKLKTYGEKRQMLYSLLTIRKPEPLPYWFHIKLDQLLQHEALERKIINSMTLLRINQAYPETNYEATKSCALWQGDITTLRIDAIVNAANRNLLGCFRPFHKCIDNAIHSAAGPRVREDCNAIMQKQGCLEETGWTKITRGYNLPSKYILHTVGPIIKKDQAVTFEQKQQLSKCYRSCLELALKVPKINSIAFCSISTGVFSFPIDLAAEIALRTVNEWLSKHPESFKLIVFNVFSEQNFLIYQNILKSWKNWD